MAPAAGQRRAFQPPLLLLVAFAFACTALRSVVAQDADVAAEPYAAVSVDAGADVFAAQPLASGDGATGASTSGDADAVATVPTPNDAADDGAHAARHLELQALELFERAEAARWGAPGGAGRNATLALQCYRDAAALRAGRGSADALAALARMHELGWDGQPDLDVYLPRALTTGADRPTPVGRIVARATRSLRPFIAEARRAAYAVAAALAPYVPALAPAPAPAGPPAGDAAAAHALVPADMSAAVRLYAAAAALGNASALFTMAVLHTHGLFGVEADERKAVLHLYFAATGGSPAAKLALGHRHGVGLGTPKHCPAAAAYLEDAARAAAEAVWASRGLLGVAPPPPRTRLDDDVADDGVESAAAAGEGQLVTFYHSAAADRGDTAAHVALGHLYLLGIRGAATDLARASEHFAAAAEEGELGSLINLAYMYLHGLGVPRDPPLALSLLEKPLEARLPAALNLLGVMLATGAGTERDDAAAFVELLKAAEAKNGDALYNVAMMRLAGTAPGGRDFRGAASALQAAAATGHVPAQYKLGYLTLHGVGLARDCSSALRALSTAATHALARSPALGNAHELLADGNAAAALLEYARAGEQGVELGTWNAAYLLERVGVPGAAGAGGGSGGGGGGGGGGDAPTPSPSPDAGAESWVGGAFTWAASGLHLPASVAARGEAFAAWGRAQPHTRVAVAAERVALRLYERSSAAGNGWADLHIGYFHQEGRAGLPASPAAAALPFLDACTRHVPEACFALGQLYELGDGVTRDLHLAKRYYDTCLANQKMLKQDAPAPVRVAFARIWLRGRVAAAIADHVAPWARWLGVRGELPAWVAAAEREAAADAALRAAEAAPGTRAPRASGRVPDETADGAGSGEDDQAEAEDDAEARVATAMERARAARLQRQRDDSMLAAMRRGAAGAADALGRRAVPAAARSVHAAVQAAGAAVGIGAAARLREEDSLLFVLSVVVFSIIALRRLRAQRAAAAAAAAAGAAMPAAGGAAVAPAVAGVAAAPLPPPPQGA